MSESLSRSQSTCLILIVFYSFVLYLESISELFNSLTLGVIPVA